MNPNPYNAAPKKKRSVSVPTLILSLVLVGIVAFVAGTRSDAILARFSPTKTPTGLNFSSLNDVYKVLRSKYDGQIDPDKLIDGAKHGLVEAAGDPYTVYFNDKEAAEFNGDLEGSFEGIGAELGKRNDSLVVISTLDDSPAKKTGLLANDVIVKVNGESTDKWSVDKAVSVIRGPKGTTVKLSVLRGDEGLKEFSITRDEITNPSVKSEILEGNIGFIRISRFGESDTTNLTRRAAEDFKAKGVKGVILDLRGNGGGYLTAARDVSSLWLEDKVVVTERAGGKITETLRADTDAPLKGIPTVVLVDGGSASASEIVAGALSDNKAAKLVGEKTFGKGSVQTIQDILSGGQLKVTVAKWYTPSGKNLSKNGLVPDETVKLTPDDINANRDPQKDKALELIRRGL
jgi:carboxyl-terminal processing protease